MKPLDPTAPRPLPQPAQPAAKPALAKLSLPDVSLPHLSLPHVDTNGIINKVMGAAEAVDGFVASHPREANAVSGAWNGLGNHVSNSIVPGHTQVASIFGWGKSDVDKLSDSTQDFRTSAGQANSLKAQLAKLPANDPKRAALQAQLTSVESSLKQKYGYADGKTPAPGSLWLDPAFCGQNLPNGQVSASQFPVGTPVTKPPTALDAMFAGGKSYSTVGTDGKTITFKNPAEYQTWLASNRAAQGMPRTDGEPIGVQMNFEGGGGKGKRYSAALTEMSSLGVVPTSVAGSSAGSIMAGLVAAGADPAELTRFSQDPQLSKLMDIDVGNMHGGVMDGKKAYDMFDQELRKLTGITDRPVTFADLKIPLQICATKMSDTAPTPGTEDMTQLKNRSFVFSQETTPNTPVALAIRASMAIPGAFDPVDVLDPTTGRQLKLTDGGVIDNLPMHESPDFGLPTVGVKLTSADDNNPANHTHPEPDKLRGGNLNVDNVILNAFYGKEMNDASHTTDGDFQDSTKPKPGQFMLGVPVFDLTDPSKGDSTLSFGWDSKTDPKLDQQTRQVTRDFFKQVLAQLPDPKASGTNLQINAPQAFTSAIQISGKTYVASYTGGDSVSFKQQGGSDSFNLNLGANKIRSIAIDGASFHDLADQLAKAARDNGHSGATAALAAQARV